jgi:hypothetical protein
MRAWGLASPAETLLDHRLSPGSPVTIELRAEDGQSVTVTASVETSAPALGAAEQPHLRISGPRCAIVRLLAGRSDAEQARAAGVPLDGNAAILARPRPPAPA